MAVSQATIRKLNNLPIEYRQIVVDQIDKFAETPAPARKSFLGRFGVFIFDWARRSGTRNAMTDAEIEKEISAARAEKHASCH